MTAPLIAIFAGRYPDDRHSVHRGYVDAVAAVGGIPVVVPASERLEPEAALVMLREVRGVVLAGGGDVESTRYGLAPHPKAMEVDPARDAVELLVVNAAMDRGLPMLGICRGIQVLAVALGGRLVPDLPDAGHDGHWREAEQYEPVHRIEADTTSVALRALAGADEVNSIHHQAVADPGPDLRATAWSDDGVIEAVEADGVLGVQWHPERLFTSDPRHLAPFSWLVAA